MCKVFKFLRKKSDMNKIKVINRAIRIKINSDKKEQKVHKLFQSLHGTTKCQ